MHSALERLQQLEPRIRQLVSQLTDARGAYELQLEVNAMLRRRLLELTQQNEALSARLAMLQPEFSEAELTELFDTQHDVDSQDMLADVLDEHLSWLQKH